ncbi:hypothetical protein EJ03DRAFT_353208 [Teratosphaeria nubilosa]|uniref:Uncharacterized protein n=1 Tax=Teratosphaeria nubilosa TaxID=161662 RepID=A0A6G1L353_9PEZI|nr:hypothetical protein EJ03DRAFT_353208 [Teratosphaeria nubilosa]
MLFSLLALSSLAAAAPMPVTETVKTQYKYFLEFQYSNKFLTVGDTALFAAIWEKGFAAGDVAGIDTDDSYTQYGFENMCIQEGSKPDLNVQIKMNGKWGVIEDMDGLLTRDQLVHAMWDMLQKVQEEDGIVWRQCASAVFGLDDRPDAVCGKFRPTQCLCRKTGGDGGYDADRCMDKVSGYRIPSEMELNIYNMDGSLRADTLTVTVASRQIVEAAAPGCGKLGAVAEVAMAMIPEFGKTFSDQVKILCRH